VRGLQEIAGIGSLGRSSPGSGRRRRCSAGNHAREGGGAPVVGEGSPVREAVGRVGRSRGGVREVWRWENERGSERGGNGSVAARQRGRKGQKGGGGSGRGVPRGLGGAVGLDPDRRAASTSA
jgi:hypothetical protein